MLVVREIERVESRVLGALRFVDAATGRAVDVPLRVVAATGTDIIRNRSGLHVIRRHPVLAGHTDAYFEPPSEPALGAVDMDVTVHDPSGVYLSRTATLALPRDPDPDNADDAASLFRPVEIALYRSPSAAAALNWAALRVSLADADSGDALGGALLRVLSNGNVLARGVTDWRGEALVPVVGIAVMTWSESDDAVIATALDATLEASFHEAHGARRTSAAEVVFGNEPAVLPAADPDAIEADADAVTTSVPVRLTAGVTLPLALTLDLNA